MPGRDKSHGSALGINREKEECMDKEKMAMKLLEMLLSQPTASIDGKADKPLVGEYVIVRCRDAGVHAGVLVDYEDRNVELKDTRRLWYFKCKTGHTLSGVALHGVNDASKIAGELSQIILSDACEIIPVSPDAERSIRNAKEYNT